MIKISAKLFSLLISIIIFPAVCLAEISQVVFITEPQTIRLGELSAAITIQSQDASGGVYQTPETLDLQFISTSGTGQFLNSSGNAATTYMGKNTANRTFYYKDSSEGTFTITVNVRGRESGIELGTSQEITVSSGAAASSGNSADSGGEVLGASSTSSVSGGSTTYVSSLNSQLEIVAGNDRSSAPGSPIWFQATVKKNTTKSSVDLNWSFGDGEVGVGPLVSHSYKYPGEYVVVLSARAEDIFSVSRLKVRVLKSDISVVDGGEYLEISNSGNSEINLFNWKVESGGKGFIFQPNTIILPKSSIKIDKSLLKMKGFDNSQSLRLKDSLGQEVFAAAPIKEVDTKEAAENLEKIKSEALSVHRKILSHASPLDAGKNTGAVLASGSYMEQPDGADEPEEGATSTQIEERIIYEVPGQEGFFAKLTNLIKRVFSK